ncbi:hypothetical protein FRX31_033009 [Thalictrum thalictroides]|uniref:RNase H type-1 domain-containing protein n=1 Tax=Thalictrum thalictroides TaxID=46969 RepID=A0A7J6UXQ8_THATH|nr:hypothetical protein FRX31_033009 [Thalictrum thalictroides]
MLNDGNLRGFEVREERQDNTPRAPPVHGVVNMILEGDRKTANQANRKTFQLKTLHGKEIQLNRESEVLSAEGGQNWQKVSDWGVFTDGSLSKERAAIGIVFISPEGGKIEIAEKLGFPVTNNEAEYKTILKALKVTQSISIEQLMVFSDSKLVVEQYNRAYKAFTGRMKKYLTTLIDGVKRFTEVEIIHLYR